MRICVVGTGYVGLVTGVCLAAKGNHVVCLDINREKIDKLNQGICTIYEPELETLMRCHARQIKYTDDYADACDKAEVIFIAVGTPENPDGSANLQYVYAAAARIAEALTHDAVVALKSTVPVGTNDCVEAIIREKCRQGVRASVVSNPEFLSQGTAVRDTFHASRIVIGTEDAQAADIMRTLYRDFDCPILVTKRRSAEMIKYASNDFLALKLSYINEIANLCEMIGADIEEVAKGMGYDPRIGSEFLKAGIGYGGSCFPKDTKALHWLANINGYELKTIKAAIEVNEAQKTRLLTKARKIFSSFKGKTVAVLGVTFKAETDDLRESPALMNLPVLLREGANVRVWDPQGMKGLEAQYGNTLTYCREIDEAIRDADVCFIYTAWKQIREYDITRYPMLMRKAVIFDGRNCYRAKDMAEQGIIYKSIGR